MRTHGSTSAVEYSYSILTVPLIPDKGPFIARFHYNNASCFYLGGLSADLMVDMACQFLDVTCIPHDLETIIREKSHGVASWCEQLVKDMLCSNYIKVVSDKEVVIQEESEMPSETTNLSESTPLPSSRPCTPGISGESNTMSFEAENRDYQSRPGSSMSRASFSGATTVNRPLSALRRKSMGLVKTLTTLRRGSVVAADNDDHEEHRKQRR